MDPDRVRSIRAALGFTQAQLARAMRLTGHEPARTVRNWESETGPRPSGPASLALEYLGQGALNDAMKKVVPEYLHARARETAEFVIRLWYPRFIARAIDVSVTLPQEVAWAWIGRDVKRLAVVMWLDDPAAADIRDILERGADLFKERTLDEIS